MALSKDEILEGIANLTVMEVVELVSAMEAKFGVSAAAAVAVAAAPAAAAPSAPALPEGHVVKSPMVGTFYRSASPESKPFVEPGAKVAENTVVCIIEAMKIMNEIQAEVKGTVVEALVENGKPVEYGQRLYKIKQG